MPEPRTKDSPQVKAEEREFIEAWERLAKRTGDMVILEMSVGQLVSMVGMMQLALRHPNIGEHVAQVSRDLLDKIIELIDDPVITEHFRRGFDPNYDVEQEP